MKATLRSAPESFYETFTYVIPAGYFWLSLMLLTGVKDPLRIGTFVDLGDTITKLLASIGLFLFLLVAGQIMNTFCHYLTVSIWWLKVKLQGKKATDKKPWRTRERNWRKAKNTDTDLSPHLSKVTAKRLMSLNLSFASFMLIVFTAVHSAYSSAPLYTTWKSESTFLIVGLASLVDYFKRHGDEGRFINSILGNE